MNLFKKSSKDVQSHLDCVLLASSLLSPLWLPQSYYENSSTDSTHCNTDSAHSSTCPAHRSTEPTNHCSNPACCRTQPTNHSSKPVYRSSESTLNLLKYENDSDDVSDQVSSANPVPVPRNEPSSSNNATKQNSASDYIHATDRSMNCSLCRQNLYHGKDSEYRYREENNEVSSVFTISGSSYMTENRVSEAPQQQTSTPLPSNPLYHGRSSLCRCSESVKTQRDGGGTGERGGGFVPPDGGWGWVVCVTALWVNGWVMGTVGSFGILYDFIVNQYDHDSSASFKASFVGSCLLGVMLLSCCISGILCDVIGLRQTAFVGGLFCVVGFASSAYVTQLELLYVTYGVILGSGFGLLYSPMVAISGHYFRRRLGLVNGIVTFGPSAFTMMLSFTLPTLLPLLGFRHTLLGFAGLALTIALATLTWKPLVQGRNSQGHTHDNESCVRQRKWKRCSRFVLSKVYDPALWHNKPFIFWCMAIAISRFGYMEPSFHLVNHVSSLLPDHNASILITIMAGTSGISKLIFGLLSDFLRNYRVFLQLGALVVYGAVLLFLPNVSYYGGFVVMAVILGLSDALIMVLFGPNVVDLVGPARASQAFGFMSLLSIPGFLSAPAITGRLHDDLGHYDTGFYLTGALLVLSAGVMVFVRLPCVSQSAGNDLVLQQSRTSSETPTTVTTPATSTGVNSCQTAIKTSDSDNTEEVPTDFNMSHGRETTAESSTIVQALSTEKSCDSGQVVESTRL